MSTTYKLALGASVGVTTLIGLFSVMPSSLAATSSSSKNAVVTVGASCSMNSTVSTAHTATIAQGNYNKGIGLTEVTTTCNDAGGYAIYAVGYGDDTLGNNVLHSATVGSTYDIATGNDFANATTSYSSNTSEWAMRVETVPGQTDSPTITNNFDSLSLVPTTYTKVAQYNANTSTPSTSSITTEYGAYIAIGQPAGTYTGKVKYTLVHPNNAAAPVVPTYMQDFTNAQCQTLATDAPYTVYDRRDGSDYTVRYINGACWMTQNLRITGTISATDSNFTGNDFNVSMYDLKTNGTGDGACNFNNSYNNVCSHLPDTADLTENGLTVNQVGAWYNYAAATAGQITGDDSEIVATQDICPAGWSMPYGVDSGTPAGSINSLYGEYGSFLPVASGSYYNGSLDYADHGYWWSTTSGFNYSRLIIVDDGTSISLNHEARSYGMNIRCVRN